MDKPKKVETIKFTPPTHKPIKIQPVKSNKPKVAVNPVKLTHFKPKTQDLLNTKKIHLLEIKELMNAYRFVKKGDNDYTPQQVKWFKEKYPQQAKEPMVYLAKKRQQYIDNYKKYMEHSNMPKSLIKEFDEWAQDKTTEDLLLLPDIDISYYPSDDDMWNTEDTIYATLMKQIKRIISN